MSETQYYGTGRRKTSTARVYLRSGSGTATVNGRSMDIYFPNDVLKMVIRQPLRLLLLRSEMSTTEKPVHVTYFVARASGTLISAWQRISNCLGKVIAFRSGWTHSMR